MVLKKVYTFYTTCPQLLIVIAKPCIESIFNFYTQNRPIFSQPLTIIAGPCIEIKSNFYTNFYTKSIRGCKIVLRV